MNGDAIWESITWLVSSLVGRRCTHQERILCYEQLLVPKKALQQTKYDEMSADEIIEYVVKKFKAFGDILNAEKICRLYARIRNYSEYDAIIRYIILLVDFKSLEQILKQRQLTADNYKPYVLRQLNFPLSVGHQPVELLPVVTCTSQRSNNKILKNTDFPDVVDERGNIERYSICPQICSFHTSDGINLFMVSWDELEDALKHLLCGEVSSLFRKNEDGFFYFWGKKCCFLDSDDCFYKLFHIVAPFLKVAQSLEEAENAFFATFRDIHNNRSNNVTKALCLLLGSVDRHIALFRVKICKYFEETNCSTILEKQNKIDEALRMSREIAVLAQVAVQICQRKIVLASYILDSLCFFRNSLRHLNIELYDVITDVMAEILEFTDKTITRWLHDGFVSEVDGVFQLKYLQDTDTADIYKGWQKDFGIWLPGCVFFDESFCKRWVQEGKLQKISKMWPAKENESMIVAAFKAYSGSELPENTAVNAKINFDKLLRRDTALFCIQKTLNDKYRVLVHSAKYRSLRKALCHLYHCTSLLIHDILLCLNGLLSDTVVRLLNDNADVVSNLKFFGLLESETYHIGVVNALMEFLSSCSVLRQDEMQLSSRFSILYQKESGFLRLSYHMIYPMQFIFPEVVMNTYSDFWSFFTRINCTYYSLLELEIRDQLLCKQARFVRAALLNFISGVREYLLFQIFTVLSLNEKKLADESFSIDDVSAAQKNISIEIRRRCLLEKGFSQLMCKIMEIIDLSSSFCSFRMDKDAMLLVYKNFLENYIYICQVARFLSADVDTWMKAFSALVECEIGNNF